MRIGEKRIAAVDDDVAFIEKWRELIDDSVDRCAGLHHDHRFARLLEGADEFLHCARRLNVFAFAAASRKFVCDFSRAIENGD